MRTNHLLDQLDQITRELRTYETYEAHLIQNLETLKEEYKNKQIDYRDYTHRRSHLLKGKTRKELISYYHSYRYSLLKQAERITTDLFEAVYSEQIPEVTPKIVKKAVHTTPQLIARKRLQIPKFGALPKLLVPKKTHLIRHALRLKFSPKDALRREKKKPTTIFSDNVSEGQKPLKESSAVTFGFSAPRFILRAFTNRFKRKPKPILSEKTEVPFEMKKLRQMREKLYAQERARLTDSTLLVQEARHVQRLINVENKKIYQGSSIGLLANITVRRLSLYLVNKFPTAFGRLYNSLRAANVQVLSNTYVNIMVLLTLSATLIAALSFSILYTVLGRSVSEIIIRTLLFSLGAGILTAAIFFIYPSIKIRDRRRKTTTNLPFAINHMAAVATSGVPPSTMFSLIAGYGEYEDVSVEVRKIVDYMNIFGYDLLTAIKTVANITPSPAFKKFLEGMVSTVETGGDLVNYLEQEAAQASLTYRLERQRYNETVSTYSDIYTGVLIAAPLFFVAALALVNLLGGTLGGYSVGSVLAVGAYVVIPILNIAFLAFLQFTQPEV